jgi:hypothetical protein
MHRSGGRFKLSWATSFFSTIPGGEGPEEAWWTMIADGEQLAAEAVAVLDATCPTQDAESSVLLRGAHERRPLKRECAEAGDDNDFSLARP